MVLSVIIPVYKVEKTIRRCLDSVVAQSFRNLEIILVDDGSPDKSGFICDEYASKDNRISVLHKQNGGLSDARNAGIDLSHGDYITFVDSDDTVDTHTYETLMSILSQHPEYDMIEFPAYIYYGSNRQRMVRLDDKVYDNIEDYWINAKTYEHCYAWNKIYKRRLFDEIRFPKGKNYEDVWTLPLILRQCRLMATVSQGLYYYYDNPNGITSNASLTDVTELLSAHLNVRKNLRKYSALYEESIVNRQIDVCRLNGDILFPASDIRIKPDSQAWLRTYMKLFTVKILGYRYLCKILTIANR